MQFLFEASKDIALQSRTSAWEALCMPLQYLVHSQFLNVSRTQIVEKNTNLCNSNAGLSYNTNTCMQISDSQIKKNQTENYWSKTTI